MTTITASDNPITLPAKISRAKRILIKPNIGYPKAHPVTVRPSLIAALVDQILAENDHCEIHLVEGVCTSASWLDVMKKTGFADWFEGGEKTGTLEAISPGWSNRVWLHDADSLPLSRFPNQFEAFHFKEIQAPALIAESDICISVAPLKKTILNGSPLFSGTIKNLFGLLPRSVYKARSPHSRGMLHRPDVHLAICDVWNCLRPHFGFGILDLESYYESPDWKPDRKNSVPVGHQVYGSNLLDVDLAGLNLVNESPCKWQELLRNQVEE